jgi:hypothetical protein
MAKKFFPIIAHRHSLLYSLTVESEILLSLTLNTLQFDQSRKEFQ